MPNRIGCNTRGVTKPSSSPSFVDEALQQRLPSLNCRKQRLTAFKGILQCALDHRACNHDALGVETRDVTRRKPTDALEYVVTRPCRQDYARCVNTSIGHLRAVWSDLPRNCQLKTLLRQREQSRIVYQLANACPQIGLPVIVRRQELLGCTVKKVGQPVSDPKYSSALVVFLPELSPFIAETVDGAEKRGIQVDIMLIHANHRKVWLNNASAQLV